MMRVKKLVIFILFILPPDPVIAADNVVDKNITTSALKIQGKGNVGNVRCGAHFAPSCAECPFDGVNWRGQGWCNGDCRWERKGGKCVDLEDSPDYDYNRHWL